MYEITVNDPGLQSTIQDLGRWGYQSKGYSVGGAMDHFALKAANILIGNDPGEACLEMTFKGVEVTFPCRAVIAVTGADMKPSLNGKPLEMWASYLVNSGDVLKLGVAQAGLRTYLSVKGGFAFKPFLGSKSTSLQEKSGSNAGQALQKGSTLPISFSDIPDDYAPKKMKASLIPAYYHENRKEIRVIGGPFEDSFTQKGIQTFYDSEYTVGHEISRVGYRLEGQPIEYEGEAGRLISLSMTTGSIQVPGGGMPIILCAERRTHGGYPVIATVISVDMSKVAQCRPGDKIRFVKVSLEEAHRLLKERENLLHDDSTMEAIEPEEVLMHLPDMVDNQYYQLYNEFF
ncbi:MAG: Allophanate hydrolase 2 subunit 2 [Firmicutes bacterium]|nr:Allophanate hydrolase 2 subunit 2 [Bacillota bacterium]